MLPQDTPTEQWLPLPGQETRYLVSTLGRVWSLRRPKYIVPQISKATRRYYLRLFNGANSFSVPLHTVIAKAFLGERPAGYEIDHRDQDRLNNRADNLEYVTPAENKRRAYIANGNRYQNARLTPDIVRFLRTPVGRSLRARDLAPKLGVSQCAIYLVWAGKTWREVQ